jgi:spectinomycin phosphotransferase
MNQKNIKNFIEKNWNISIKRIKEEPSGEASDTYIIWTDKDKFIAKIVRTSTSFGKEVARNIENSLEVLMNLRNLGIEEISNPVLSLNGKLIEKFSGRPTYLIKFIEGRCGEENWNLNAKQYFKLGRLIGRIHKSTKELKKLRLKRENISKKRYYEEIILKNFKKALLNNDSPSHLFKAIQKDLYFALECLEESRNKLKSSKNFVLCHRDLIGENLIVNKEEVCIIDWDGAGLNLKEKDLWFRVFNKNFLKGYKEGFGPFELNINALTYYCCDRLLDDTNEYMEKYLEGDKKEKERAEEQIKDYILIDLKKIRQRIERFKGLKNDVFIIGVKK